MTTHIKPALFSLCILILTACSGQYTTTNTAPAREVLTRIIGREYIDKFTLNIDPNLEASYAVNAQNNSVMITASDQVSLCRGAYDFLTHAGNSIVSWSGNRIDIPEPMPSYSNTVKSPYSYRYYMNVVTHGYTTPYWDWERWEKEIDWMAVHGMNMPLIPGAHEAILYRVFKKLGLSEADVAAYFTGPAHFPWNRMGNITAWDGPIPDSYFEKQIALNHQILDRMAALDMHPIVPAFAGFIPPGIRQLFPEEKIRKLRWGGFETQYQAYILEPGSDLFIAIGRMYIEEYEKEFGKQEFYLADSFNEMDVPLSADPVEALQELSSYGASVYRSIQQANPQATWVMQGWTFPYQKKDGELFWTPDRLAALIADVPDDKLLILDLANEYNRLWWRSEPSWKKYSGFFGKPWIYSFIPNMGGKTAYNGRLDLYASMASEAFHYDKKGKLAGFGFAPEGIENNEIIYELLADVGWTNNPIDLQAWIERYGVNRYGAFPEPMKMAFDHLTRSVWGSFTDHPRNTYQLRPNTASRGTVNTSDDLRLGVQYFLSCKEAFKDNALYEVDAIEMTCQYLGVKADALLAEFLDTGANNQELLDQALKVISNIDRLLASHPNWRLEQWTQPAKKWGDTPEEKRYYEANARRLITTWGGTINDYAAKTWSGLIRDYYIPRWRNYYKARANGETFDMLQWEEEWIHRTDISTPQPFEDPLDMAQQLFDEFSMQAP